MEDYTLVAVPRGWVRPWLWAWFSGVSGAWPLNRLILRWPVRNLLTVPVPAVDRKALALQLQDLLNNAECPCAGTPDFPCSRCSVSLEQSRELLDAYLPASDLDG